MTPADDKYLRAWYRGHQHQLPRHIQDRVVYSLDLERQGHISRSQCFNDIIEILHLEEVRPKKLDKFIVK